MINYILAKSTDKITQYQRNKLMYFNTKRYWHTWYDIKSNNLYNEYGYCINTDAKAYLLSIGTIDENNNKLFQFEEN